MLLTLHSNEMILNRYLYRQLSNNSARNILTFKRSNSMANPIRLLARDLLKKRVESSNKIKEKSILLNNADIQIIGSDNLGFSPCVILKSEGNSYMFNCSEGTQRLCYSNKIKLTNLQNIFITNAEWRRLSGVFGMSLTLQDIGIPSLTIHSTEIIEGLFNPTRSFMSFTSGMELLATNIVGRDFSNSGLRVKSIVIDGPSKHRSELYNVNSVLEESGKKRHKCVSRVLSYVCTLPDLPGSLNPQRCRELNVPVGPMLRQLKSGQDVTLRDGTLVRSKDVCEPVKKGMKFLVLECPDEEHIDRMISNIDLEAARKARNIDEDRPISFVIHFSPSEIVDNQEYQRWMDGFPEDCKHILLSKVDSKSMVNFVDCYRLQYILNFLDPNIFPNLFLTDELRDRIDAELEASKNNDPDELKPGHDSDDEDIVGLSARVKCKLVDLDREVKAINFERFSLRPETSVETIISEMDIDMLYKSSIQNPLFEDILKELRTLQKNLPVPSAHEPEVVFLGTGSALPSKLRNTSAILINFTQPESYSVILDCGEDTLGQLTRLYGPEGTSMILKQLKMIYVSHHHADHHISLTRLIAERANLTHDKLNLLIPPGISKILNFYNDNFENISDSYRIFNTQKLKANTRINPSELQDLKLELYDSMSGLIENITIVDVEHCINSCAVVLKFHIGHEEMKSFTISYSGDARPSDEFALAGSCCDLLIHEATFDHRGTSDALSKQHATSTEAIQVARKMQAKFAILTHFSQRLAKLPYFTTDFDDKIGFAFDNMSIKCPSQLPRIPILKSILNVIFTKAVNDIDMKYYKQDLRKQRMMSIAKSVRRVEI